MKNSNPVTISFRRVFATAVAVFCISHSSFCVAATSPSASVVSIEPTRVADLVLLNNGLNAGLRQGMVCRVTRGSTEIAEVLLVESRPTCSAALILNVTPKQAIRGGDTAAVKVLKT